MGVDLVIEALVFSQKRRCRKHLQSGAKSSNFCSCSKPDITVVYGINENEIRENDKIISNGSCTTNCLAPIAYIVDKELEIESGYMTTVHSVTGDQNTIDTLHKDLRRARNSLISIIPTSTGAARAVSEVYQS